MSDTAPCCLIERAVRLATALRNRDEEGDWIPLKRAMLGALRRLVG